MDIKSMSKKEKKEYFFNKDKEKDQKIRERLKGVAPKKTTGKKNRSGKLIKKRIDERKRAQRERPR